MKNYYRLFLGIKHSLVDDCLQHNYIGVNFNIKTSLASINDDKKLAIDNELLNLYLSTHTDKSKAQAYSACSPLYLIAKGFAIGDIVICPNGKGQYLAAEIISNYHYNPLSRLPHQRSVKWLPKLLEHSYISSNLMTSLTARSTLVNLSKHNYEIDVLLKDNDEITVLDATKVEMVNFAFERHLEDFLVANWASTELGKIYDIYEDENGYGRQYSCDTGIIDILALAKDKSHYLVVELKKGSASDKTVGQIQRYMGFVKEQLLEANQTVKGVIIALDDDLRIRRALSVATNIEFYRYKVDFKVFKNDLNN